MLLRTSRSIGLSHRQRPSTTGSLARARRGRPNELRDSSIARSGVAETAGSAAAAAASSSPRELMAQAENKLRRTQLALAPHRGPPEARFKVLQWNVLADGLAQHGDFVKVPPEVLEWEYRMPLLLAEVAEAQADVICIQELNHYEELLKQLRPLGYEGSFLPKHCSPAARYQCPADGLAIFFNTKRFERTGPPTGHNYLAPDGHKQSQGFMQVCLRDLVVGRALCIATTHLKSKEGVVEEQMRTQQIRQLLHHLKPELLGEPLSVNTAAPALVQVGSLEPGAETTLGSSNGSNGRNGSNGNNSSNGVQAEAPCSSCDCELSDEQQTVAAVGGVLPNGEPPSSSSDAAGGPQVLPTMPVIIAGDFNATPESVPCREMKAHPAGFQSIWDVKPVYPAASASVAASSRAYEAVGSGTGDEETEEANSGGGASEEEVSEFSTWKFRSKGESKRIIDHLWFTKDRRLKPVSRWRMLTEQEIGPNALPCGAYASDHQALCIEFEWQ